MTDTLAPTPFEPWLRVERADLAIERILTAAGQAFADRGIEGSSIAEVAKRAGCSRGTVYRFFGTRDALRSAFIESRGAQIAEEAAGLISDVSDPADMIVKATTEAVRLIREDPVLISWFQADNAATTASMFARSQVIHSLASRFIIRMTRVWDNTGAVRLAGRFDIEAMSGWVVRVVLSLLLFPVAPDDPDAGGAAETQLLHRFLVPALLA